MPVKMPSIFLGHGNPMNAIRENGYTEAWQRIGVETPRPKVILSVSAHWYVPATGGTWAVLRHVYPEVEAERIRCRSGPLHAASGPRTA